MSTLMDEDIKRWTAKRTGALVLELIQGRTTVAEASRTYDLPLAEIGTWVEQEPSFGSRTVAHLLGMNKSIVQRVFQLLGRLVKKRPVGFRPRV
jgi:hypothetical protein